MRALHDVRAGEGLSAGLRRQDREACSEELLRDSLLARPLHIHYQTHNNLYLLRWSGKHATWDWVGGNLLDLRFKHFTESELCIFITSHASFTSSDMIVIRKSEHLFSSAAPILGTSWTCQSVMFRITYLRNCIKDGRVVNLMECINTG